MKAADWYKGRRVFVTGHTGFKGSWLCLWLQSLGAEVTGYALEPEADGLFVTSGLADTMTSITGNICNRADLARAMSAARPEILFHMAAQSLVRLSYQSPLETYETNVMGTACVLDCAREIESLRSIIVVTSDKCYENTGSGLAFREGDAMGGHDPYSSSKGCTELVAAAYARSFFKDTKCGIATVRAGNVIGGGDWSQDRIIPDLMRDVRTGTATQIRQPSAIRPWQHVLEPLRGYLMLGHRLAGDRATFGGAWNFGPRAAGTVTVGDMVKEIIRYWPAVQAEYSTASLGPYEAATLSLDSGKAGRILGWRPVLSFAETIEMTVDWYRRAQKKPSGIAEVAPEHIRKFSETVTKTEASR